MRYLLLFLVGALTGAIIALLYAPTSGKKTRKKIAKQTKRWQLEMEAQTEKSFDRVNNWRQSVEEMAENAAKNMNGQPAASEINFQ